METDEPAEPAEPADPNIWAPDADAESLVLGDPHKAVSDEDMEAANDLLSEARNEAREGNFHQAIQKLTEAIKRNPAQSNLFAFRAEYLLKERKPNAAIRDASKALQLNPDSTRALKARGKGKRHIGKYLEAFYDLSQGNSLDWDENTAELIKEISERAERAKQKQRKDDEKARLEQLKRDAAEKRRRQQEEEDRQQQYAGGAGGGGPGMEGLNDLFAQLNDPEIQTMFKNNPNLIQKVMKAISGDASVLTDPEVQKVIQKLQSSFGGGGHGGAPPHAQPHAHPHAHPHEHPHEQKPSSKDDDLD
jgi:suppressor of tumorigenicity protein 13